MRQLVPAWLVTISVFAAAGCVVAAQNAAPAPVSATAAQATPATGVTAAQAPVSPAAAAQATVSGGRLHGVVKSGSVPLPGVTVTAENTLTGKRYATTTDITGAWSMTIPQDGRYVVRTEFAAFAQQSEEALFNATKSRDQALNFSLMLASRAAAEEQQTVPGAAQIQQAIRELTTNGPQSLSLASALGGDTEAASGATESAAGNGAALPSIAGDADFSGDSVSVNGQSGQVSPLAGMDPNKLRDLVETLRAEGAIGGLMGNGNGFGGAFGGGFVSGPGGPGGRGGFGGGRFGGMHGNFRGFNPGQPHGAIFWFGSNSALNAEPYSLLGQPEVQQASGSNRFGLTFMSAPYIPGLIKPSGKDTIFLTLSGTRSSSPQEFYDTVPTDAERAGQIPCTTNATTCPDGFIHVTPVAQAVALLQYIPEPNVPGQTLNYHELTTAQSNTTQAGFRYLRSIGANASPFGYGRMGGFRHSQSQGLRQSVNLNYNWSHSAADSVGLLPILGGKTASDSYSLQTGYTIGYRRLTSISNVSWNRSDSNDTNYFTNGTDIATQLGILGPDGAPLNANPLNYGVPNISMSSFTGISEDQPSLSISQTISVSETLAWRHNKHNMRFGGDYRRVHRDYLGGGNATGTFLFTGAYTNSALGDFLTGRPQQTTISAAEGKTYLRDNVYDFYAQDDWRARSNLTLMYGLRYDFYAPYTEKYNHLAMVDTNPDGNFTSVGQVTAGGASPNYGPLPDSLVYPYRIAFSPRFGMAWRLPKLKDTVLRGGYGVNYTVGEYSTFASNLAYQPPFVNEQSNICDTTGETTPTPCYSLANGFPAPNTIGTYALNPHYRLPHVQAYNVDLQKTLPWGIVMNLGYNGARGGNMDIKIAPRSVPGSLGTDPGNYPWFYLEDGAFYRFNAGTVRVNKRLSGGIAVGANYQWSHAIDNAGGVGGTAPITAQNWQDIAAEIGNSSVDQRHKVSGSYLYELPFGKDRQWATSGAASHILEGFSISGSFTFATGMWMTPTYQAEESDVSRGTAGTLRPDYVAGRSITAGGGSRERWFNVNAFTAPATMYGTAARNSIEGPGTISNNMSLSKTMQMGDTRSFEIRATADNVFNTVQYSGVNTSLPSSADASTTSSFGQVTSTAAMRSFQFTARFRF